MPRRSAAVAAVLTATVRFSVHPKLPAYAGIGDAGSRDFRERNGVLRFAPGQRVAQIRVQILADRLVEGPEKVFVTLADAQGAALVLPTEGTLVIRAG